MRMRHIFISGPLWLCHTLPHFFVNGTFFGKKVLVIEQVNLFSSLGNTISYEGELDTDNKLNNFLESTGILNNEFRPQKTL